MKTFKQYIEETPDTMDDTYSWMDDDAIPFGIVNNVLYYINGNTHGGLTSRIHINNEDDFNSAMNNKSPTEFNFVVLGVPQYDDEKYENLHYREDFDISGRAWSKANAISFWNSFKDVQPYLPLIVKFLKKLKIPPVRTKYEFIDSRKIYNWSELGFDKPDSKDVKSSADIAKDQAVQHVASPLLKKKKENPPAMIRRGKLIPRAGQQLSPGGRPIIGDSVENITFKTYIEEHCKMGKYFTPFNMLQRKILRSLYDNFLSPNEPEYSTFNVDDDGNLLMMYFEVLPIALKLLGDVLCKTIPNEKLLDYNKMEVDKWAAKLYNMIKRSDENI